MVTDLSLSQNNASSSKELSVVASDDPRLGKLKKCLYQADQQVKYLHLQAEIDSLLQQLQQLKDRKQEGKIEETCSPS